MRAVADCKSFAAEFDVLFGHSHFQSICRIELGVVGGPLLGVLWVVTPTDIFYSSIAHPFFRNFNVPN